MMGSMSPFTVMEKEVDSSTFMSYNSIGIDNPVKCSWLNNICDEYNVDFLSIQEHFKSSKKTDKFFRDQFPSYDSVIVPGYRSPGQDTGRAKAGLGQLIRKNLSIRWDKVTSKLYRVLPLPIISVLWINTYLPVDPQLTRNLDDIELQGCLNEVETIITNTAHDDIIWGSDLNWDLTRNTQFSQIMRRFMEKLNLVTLWSHYDINHTFEQICRNGRVSHSTVDHFVVSQRLLPLVEGCGVIHRGDNLSVLFTHQYG